MPIHKTIFSLSLFFLLLGMLYLSLKKMLYHSLNNIRKLHQQLKNDYAVILEKNNSLKQKNSSLKVTLEKTVALYEVAKEICRYLDEDKVFDAFKEQIKKHLQLKDCKFLKGEADLNPYRDYDVTINLELHKNAIGYLVADGIRSDDRATFQILAQQFVLAIKRAVLYQKVQELAITDTLTQILTRRYWLERFNEEVARSTKLNLRFACLMIDVDRFKEFNDRYGHLVGDVILKEVSRVIKESIREIDIIGRFGGEEFCVVLTETNPDAAQIVASRILKAVEQKIIRAYDEDLKVTISIGISVFPEGAKDTQGLIDKADEALYLAKNTGRNKVCLA